MITAEQYQSLIALVHSCDEQQIDGPIPALKQRRAVLGSIRGAAVRVGAQVETMNLKPKYLAGLKGEVTQVDGKRCTVLLDEESTQTLKFSSNRYYASTTKQHRLSGIPTQCAVVQPNG